MVAAEICTGWSLFSNVPQINPPIIAPTKKTRFQTWVFQLKLKKLTDFPKPAAEHIVRKLDEKPND